MKSLNKTLWALAALLIIGLLACFTYQLSAPSPKTIDLAMVLLSGFSGLALMGAYLLYALPAHLALLLEPNTGTGSTSGTTEPHDPGVLHRMRLEQSAMHALSQTALLPHHTFSPKEAGARLREAIGALVFPSATTMACPCPAMPTGLRDGGAADKSIEAEIQAEGKTAARVTPADIEANITSEVYFTADEGVLGASKSGGCNDSRQVFSPTSAPEGSLKLLTFCVLVLRNGTKLVGVNYGAIDPARHNADEGRKSARENAVEQIWPLMGYELRTQLANQR